LREADGRRRWSRAIKGGLDKADEKLFVFTPIFFIPFSFRFSWIYRANRLLSVFAVKKRLKRLGLKDAVLWLYHPFDHFLPGCFRGSLSIFDWAEDWSMYFKEFDEEGRKMVASSEETMVKNVDLVFVVSEKLLGRARGLNANSYHVFDGTSCGIFKRTPSSQPGDVKGIKKPILGYLGTINERIDVGLLEHVSGALPDVSIVMIGAIHSRRVDISRLVGKENVYFLGPKDYETLGGYTDSFDICILPYRPVSSFPTKILDYLATGKPIVSTSGLWGVDRFGGLIRTAGSKEDFVRCVRESLGEDDPARAAARRRAAGENSWDIRAGEIMETVKKRRRELGYEA
jgi:glycosyltransferase involved in cell wall biosynthesis